MALGAWHTLNSRNGKLGAAQRNPTKDVVIESKQSRFDVTSGVPQALSYMLAQLPTVPRIGGQAGSRDGDGGGDRFGMVTNGRKVIFLKLKCELIQGKTNQMPTYSQSRVYQVIEMKEGLTQILQGLKAIGQLLQS